MKNKVLQYLRGTIFSNGKFVCGHDHIEDNTMIFNIEVRGWARFEQSYDNPKEFQDAVPPPSKCPTAAELNEMGVRCETCTHADTDPGSDTLGYCEVHKLYTTIGAFCHHHPKLQRER